MDVPVTAKSALLQVLVSGDGYGLDLIERVRDRTDGRILLHQGSVYPALRSLEREGLVESYEAETTPERGGRPRRYYNLTAKGLRAVRADRAAVLGLFHDSSGRRDLEEYSPVSDDTDAAVHRIQVLQGDEGRTATPTSLGGGPPEVGR